MYIQYNMLKYITNIKICWYIRWSKELLTGEGQA